MASSDAIVIAHAGVGRRNAHSIQAVCELCERAAQKGRQAGNSTRDPTIAVVEAIRTLEESPFTNAGTGSNVNRECAVECDASLVEGWSQKGGSVGAVPSASHAILIAHKMLMADGGPACLVGPGALSWFRENCGEMPEKEVITNNQRKMFAKYSTAAAVPGAGTAGAVPSPAETVPLKASAGSHTASNDEDDFRLDTVGAVALVGGRIAAGVSSGGTFLKPPGRVGQAGVYGAGCWADRTAGVSTSGTGEHLIRTLLASRCVAALGRTQKEGGMGDEEHGEPPPAMKLKAFLEKGFVESPCVRDGGVHGMAAGVVGLVYDDEFQMCDLVWAHTSANFILAYSAPGPNKDILRSEVCPQNDIEDIERIRVYASGTTVRLS